MGHAPPPPPPMEHRRRPTQKWPTTTTPLPLPLRINTNRDIYTPSNVHEWRDDSWRNRNWINITSIIQTRKIVANDRHYRSILRSIVTTRTTRTKPTAILLPTRMVKPTKVEESRIIWNVGRKKRIEPRTTKQLQNVNNVKDCYLEYRYIYK